MVLTSGRHRIGLRSARRLTLVIIIVAVGAVGLWRYRGSANTLFLGDSILYGLNSAARFRFAANGAQMGALTADLLEHYHSAFATQRFERYVIMIGVNDLLHNVEDSVIRRNIVTLVGEIQQQGGEIVLCSLLPLGDRWDERARLRVKDVNDWLRHYAAEDHLRYLDFYSAMVDADGLPRADYLADGLHPTEQGYSVMSAMLARLLEQGAAGNESR